MKDVTRMPTTLQRLQEILHDGNWPDEDDDVFRWLQWCCAHLENRKQYHRKRALKLSLMQKMAATLLSEDELAQIDEQAEAKLVEQEDKNG